MGRNSAGCAFPKTPTACQASPRDCTEKSLGVRIRGSWLEARSTPLPFLALPPLFTSNHLDHTARIPVTPITGNALTMADVAFCSPRVRTQQHLPFFLAASGFLSYLTSSAELPMSAIPRPTLGSPSQLRLLSPWPSLKEP